MEGKNPGKAMRSIAIGSLITLDEVALEQCEGGGTCSNKAKEAIEAYRDMEKNGFSFPTLSKYIGVSIKDDDTGEVVYVYNYMFIVTFAAGIFIAYVLFSFGIDIAVRIFKLAFTSGLSISFSLPDKNKRLQTDFKFSSSVNLSMLSCNGVIIAISFGLTFFLNKFCIFSIV